MPHIQLLNTLEIRQQLYDLLILNTFQLRVARAQHNRLDAIQSDQLPSFAVTAFGPDLYLMCAAQKYLSQLSVQT